MKFALQPSKSSVSITEVDINAAPSAQEHERASSPPESSQAPTGARRIPMRSSLKKPPGAVTTGAISPSTAGKGKVMEEQESFSEKELKKFGDSIGFGGEGAAVEEDSESEESFSDMTSSRPMAADLKLPKVVGAVMVKFVFDY